jgi:hypothetical protein
MRRAQHVAAAPSRRDALGSRIRVRVEPRRVSVANGRVDCQVRLTRSVRCHHRQSTEDDAALGLPVLGEAPVGALRAEQR